MAGRGMPTGPKGAIVMVMMVLGAALAGVPTETAGLHSTCKDGIDNAPLNGDIDGGDDFCLIYPWEDGGGEKITQVGVTIGENGETSGTMNYVSSAFQFWLSNPDVNTPAPCDLAATYYTFAGGTWDNSDQEALAFANDPVNGCPPPPP